MKNAQFLYFTLFREEIIIHNCISANLADLRKDCCSRGVTSTITKLLTWSQERFVVLMHL